MSSIRVKTNWIKKTVEIWGDFVSLFFPAYCLGCTRPMVKGEEMLCTYCLLELPKTNYHRDEDNPVKLRMSARLPVRHAFAFLKFRKTGIVQHLLHQLKYNNHPEIGEQLGKIYGWELSKHGFDKEFDLIIPIPLHKSRKQRRGYNQSAKFAEGLSATLKIPFDDAIASRTTKTSTQTRKTKLERWENVKDVFVVSNPEKIVNKRILLVDDVMTTGATLEACGNQLVACGCGDISIACIAEA